MPVYGLIGKKLSHSFSKKYFSEKFRKEGLHDHHYHLFELAEIEEVQDLMQRDNLKGFNVTLPYKEVILPYLSFLDASAQKVGAVNVVKLVDGQMHGYNSDYYGFKVSLENWLTTPLPARALVLGTGGASKAVTAALKDLGIDHILVSRNKREGVIAYEELSEETIKQHHLIINTTPLGMSPHIDQCPEINYNALSTKHFLYDLVYNPETSKFLSLGRQNGAKVKNGLEMLYLQAEKSWNIWNKNDG